MKRAGRRRLLIAALAVFLTFTGAGTASGYWSAGDRVSGTAKAATVGIAQTVHPAPERTPLKTTYSASSLTAAGAVSIANTGSREGSYTLTVHANSASVSGLPGAIGVAIAAVASAEQCTPTTTLSSPATGRLSTSTPFTFTGAVAAGRTVVLCVKTSMSSNDASTYANQSAELALQSRLAYGNGAWTQSAAGVSFTQSVGSSLLFFTDSSGRYLIRNQGICVQRFPMVDTHYLARDTGCGGYAEQWRMFRASDGTFAISWAQNTNSDAIAPRWTALSGSQTLETRSAETSAQRWKIVGIAGDQYRIESVAFPGHCVTVGDGLWQSTDTNPRRLVLAACRDTEAQRFVFELQGTPITPVQDMSCTRIGQYLEFGFAANKDYQQEIHYRALLANASTPDTKRSFVPSANDGLSDGWNTFVRVYDAGENLASYVSGAGGGVGNTWVYVEQQIAGSPWTTTAKGTFHIARSGGQLAVSCGWR
ncbi:RICIN domain-containing protein [Microbacterium sp. JZ31]|uniref:RICIN domain-containing protein n=1 Tax=Microbacterium sp. JZ31 TaxID=1906274 RepID=UPI0019334F8E|nr:hypothetical protein [Microbacterium sp. JZ31]